MSCISSPNIKHMNKPVLKNLKDKLVSKPAVMQENHSEELIKLSKEMKSYLLEAASDLLQPRPEAIAQLLKKSLVK